MADRAPDLVRQLVYLDAVILENGQTMLGALSPEAAQARLESARMNGGLAMACPPPEVFGIRDEAQAKHVQARLTPHPLGNLQLPRCAWTTR